MKIEHSPLKNEFISFWIETHVDGVLRYETMIDFMRCAWCTTHALHDQPILLQGDLDTSLSEDEMVEAIKPVLESAIQSGELQ